MRYESYKLSWTDHQSKQVEFFKSEALKTKFRNSSTYNDPQYKFFISKPTPSIIFSGDNQLEKN